MISRRWLPWFSVGSTLLLLLGIWLAAGLTIIKLERSAEATLADMAPRYARLEGLLQSQERIERDLEQQQAAIEAMAYPAGINRDQVGARLQQELRTRISRAGVQIGGSRVSSKPPEDDQPWGVIAVNIDMTGTLDAVRDAFIAVAALRPVVDPVTARMQAESLGRAEEGDQKLKIDVRFEALYLAPGLAQGLAQGLAEEAP